MAVKRQMHGGPSRPEPQSPPAVKSSKAGGANTKGRSLTHSAFWEAFS